MAVVLSVLVTVGPLALADNPIAVGGREKIFGGGGLSGPQGLPSSAGQALPTGGGQSLPAAGSKTLT